MFYKFKQNEVIRNRIKLYPKYNFKTVGGTLRLNNQHLILETQAPYGALDLYDYAGTLSDDIYAIVPKTSDMFITNDVTLSSYTSSAYGTEFTQTYPITFQIDSDRILAGEREEYINSISQIAKLYYRHLNNSVDADLNSITKTVINIPRIYYGSSIRKGSVVCKIWDLATNLLLVEARDEKQNGLLYQTNQDLIYSMSGSVVGEVLYNHGIMIFTSSVINYDGQTQFGEESLTCCWNLFMFTGTMDSTEMELEFQGVNYLNTITMFAHAPSSQINHSNNKTYKKRVSGTYTSTGSNHFLENSEQEIKNIVYNGISDQTGSFEKEVYINKIGIYDEDKKLLAVTTLSNPVRKKQNDGYTFKIKKDLL